MFNDPIADLLTRIRNGNMAKHRYVDIPLSKMICAIVKVLGDKGFIYRFAISEERKVVRVFLKYDQKRGPVLQGLRRYSKLGNRKYVGYRDIPRVLRGFGTSILSTPKGVMDGATAKKEKVGGELLCCVW